MPMCALFLCLRLLHGELEHNVLVRDLLVDRREGVELGLHVHLRLGSQETCAHWEKRVSPTEKSHQKLGDLWHGTAIFNTTHMPPVSTTSTNKEKIALLGNQSEIENFTCPPPARNNTMAWFGSTRAYM